MEQIKQNIREVSSPTQEMRNEGGFKDPLLGQPSLYLDVKKRETMIPVNMAKTLTYKEVEWKKDNIPEEKETKEKDINKEKCNNERGDVLLNQKLFNNSIRNKFISNKINQKIMELTKNMSVEIVKPPIVFEEKRKCPLEENQKYKLTHTEQESRSNGLKIIEPIEKISSSSMSDPKEKTSTKHLNNRNKSKKCKNNKEMNSKPNEVGNQHGLNVNPKQPVISNDDLFFTNRRRHSVFNRTFRSILCFESDILNDLRDSDEDLSIHEIYVKKPYYRHDSKSCTDQPDHDMSAIKKSEANECSTKG